MGHGGALIQTGDVSLGILLEVERPALPRHGREDGRTGGRQALVLVADDELRGVSAALLPAGEEGAPMDFRFAQGDADSEDGAFAIGPDAQGNQDGTVEDLAALADFFVAGIQKDARQGGRGR